MCGKISGENKTSIAVWLALALTLTGLITGWTLNNIENNKKQDIDIAVLNTQFKNINDKLDIIGQKLDEHVKGEKK